MRHEADQLNGRLAKTENSLSERETNIRKDFNLTKEAKEKVGQAQLNSNEAKSQVEKAMKDIKAIIDELADLRDIDIKSLDALGKYSINSDHKRINNDFFAIFFFKF